MKSMRSALAVIGAGYGDEGKGLMTDFLAAKGADVVVRSNGGAQAGHTVVSPAGVRHVFHHFCSGALAGVPSHLSRFFVSHPMLHADEREQLIAKGANVAITADPRGVVTTPWDMMLNQFIETRRGAARHGSCGIGFGEAIERSLRPEYLVTVGDLHDCRNLRDRLAAIRKDWVPSRLAKLGGGELSVEEAALVADEAVLEHFVEDCAFFASTARPRHDGSLSGTVIFEGAQGLMLDQDYGAFPHVTRSNTGIRNMSAIASEAGIDRIDAVYMTRIYATRHGAGPLTHEGVPVDFVEVNDSTNVRNGWQGSLRVAPLDTGVLARAVAHDLATVAPGVRVTTGIGVTCLDQLVADAGVATPGGRIRLSTDVAARELGRLVGQRTVAASWGPCRSDVQAGELLVGPAARRMHSPERRARQLSRRPPGVRHHPHPQNGEIS